MFALRLSGNLPIDLYGQASVDYGDTFLMVGGRCSTQCTPDGERDEILEFDPDKEEWIVRSEKMAVQRRFQAALLVGDNVVECPS